MIRVLAIAGLSCFLISGEARADFILVSGLGATIGTLEKETGSLSVQGLNYSFGLSWNPRFSSKPWPLVIGAQLKQLKLNFKEEGINKRATYDLYGTHLGVTYNATPTFLIQITGEYSSTARITALSSNSLRLNGRKYQYASFEEYTGPAAVGARLQLSRDQIDGQFSARNRYRTGVGFGVVQQSFKHESTQITTSDSDLSPSKTYTSRDVTYRALLLNIDLFIGLTF